MARLEVEIGGSVSGLSQAANRAVGILGNLQRTADNLKVELFNAKDVATLNATGGALVSITSKIKEYTNAAIKGSVAFQDNQTGAILDSLSVKLSVLTGNADLFGSSLKNQQAQIKAYENAISKLLQNGLSPADARISSLKANIDSLNKAMDAGKVIPLNAQFQQTGKLIPDLENKIKRLKLAISESGDSRSLALYNVRLRTAQEELQRLKKLGIEATASTNGLGKALDRNATSAQQLAGRYNTVGLEFGRIIQDAPYAANNFGAIGNNITRLVEVLPGYRTQLIGAIKAQGGVATSGAVLSQGLKGIFSGFNGLSIAVSVAVAAYTIYTMWAQKAEKETKELDKATVDYIDTLRGVERAQLEGQKSAQEDLVTLRLLYKAYQDATLPLEQRKEAYQQIQQLYPEYFANMAFEQTASKATRDAYNELTGSIIATSKARAAANLITKNSERQLDNSSKIAKERAELEKINLRTENARAAVSRIRGIGAEGAARTLGQLEAQQEAVLKRIADIEEDSNILRKENLRLEIATTAEIKKGAQLVDLKLDKEKKAKKGPATPVDRSDQIIQSSDNSLDILGLEGIDRDVEAVRQKYIKLQQDLVANAKKSAEGRKTLEADTNKLIANEASEISKIIIIENERVASEIERIRNESGIKASENRSKELAQVEKWYDDQVLKAAGNADILIAIEEGRTAQIEAINEKYYQKRVEAEQKIIDQIEAIQQKEFTQNVNNTKKGSEAIDKELAKRLRAYKEYFDKLRKLYEGDVLGQIAITQSEKTVTKQTTDDAAAAKDGGLGKEFTRAVRKFGEDFYRTLTTLNQQADQTFTGIFTTLVSGFTDAMNDIFLNVFQKKFAEAVEAGTSKLGGELTAIVSGVGLLGGIISGSTKKTSSAGQGIGGALSGAASGAAIGSIIPGIGTAIGAVVGGLIGGISGLLKASKARKQEELQKKQLAEAEKQTKLLERQNALAYTSSIIGRMTTSGIVKGVEVNEFGQLSTKIVGKDIQVVLDRANRSRKRGN